MFETKDYDKEFDNLFWEKRKVVEKVVRKYATQKAVVDDIIQNIFLKIYLNIKKVLRADNINGFIYRVALNETIDYFRKNKQISRQISITPELENRFFISRENVESSLHTKEMLEIFMNSVNKMTEKRRNILLMRIVEEKHFSEIADILNISEANARNLFSIGIKGIRKKIDMGINYG